MHNEKNESLRLVNETLVACTHDSEPEFVTATKLFTAQLQLTLHTPFVCCGDDKCASLFRPRQESSDAAVATLQYVLEYVMILKKYFSV